jgi:error-prone DNA polymerase
LKAFGGYAFSKAHAAAFAVITYWSAWLRCHHPVPFFAGLLRQQPMGFYPAHVVLSDARRVGVRFLPVDLRHSQAVSTMQAGAVRLGLQSIHRLGTEQIRLLLQERRHAPFRSLTDLLRRTALPRPTMESLLLAGALDYLHPTGDRRRMLWELAEAYHTATGTPLLELSDRAEQVALPPMTTAQRLATELAVTGVSARHHPTDLRRKFFARAGALPVAKLSNLRNGQLVTVGGMVVTRQHPPTARGICFLALEDSSGLLNVVVYPDVYAQYRAGCRATFALIHGQLQLEHGAVHVVAREVVAV